MLDDEFDGGTFAVWWVPLSLLVCVFDRAGAVRQLATPPPANIAFTRGHSIYLSIYEEASRAGLFSSLDDHREFVSSAYARLSVAIQRATAIGATDAARRIRENATAALVQDGIAPAH